jgi:hypothetical protein
MSSNISVDGSATCVEIRDDNVDVDVNSPVQERPGVNYIPICIIPDIELPPSDRQRRQQRTIEDELEQLHDIIVDNEIPQLNVSNATEMPTKEQLSALQRADEKHIKVVSNMFKHREECDDADIPHQKRIYAYDNKHDIHIIKPTQKGGRARKIDSSEEPDDNELLARSYAETINRQSNQKGGYTPPDHLGSMENKTINERLNNQPDGNLQQPHHDVNMSASDWIDSRKPKVDDSKVKALQNTLARIESDVNTANANILTYNIKLKQAADQYRYLSEMQKSSKVFTPINMNTILANSNLFNPELVKELNGANDILSNDPFHITNRIIGQENIIAVSKKAIEDNIADIVRLSNDGINTGKELIKEQMSYIEQLKKNPVIVRSGEEVMRDFMMAEMYGDQDFE